MRYELVDHALSFELGDWSVSEPSRKHIEALTEHGVYLTSHLSEAQLHIRAGSTNHIERSPAALIALLRAQQWNSKPSDEIVLHDEERVIVGGTFDATPSGYECVREWFITNGARIANVALIGSRAGVEASKASAERLVATLRFEE